MSMAGPLKAQDTIPFLDSCFSYQILRHIFPPFEEYSWDSVRQLESFQKVVNKICTLTYAYRIPMGTNILGIAFTADSCTVAQSNKSVIFTYNDNIGYTYFDSILTDEFNYRKKMFFDYQTDHNNYYPSSVVPCYIYLFNEKATINDTVFYARYQHPHFNNEYYCYAYSVGFRTATEGLVFVSFPETSTNVGNGHGGIIFPILKLPCPAPRKVNVGTNFSGRVEFHWNPGGDTMLYQLAFHSADDGRLMFETDTLTDTTFTLVDSIAPAEMVNGRYEVRVRKACDYTGAPIANPLVWSDWSEPRTFNYMHRVEGIEDIDGFGPQFTLSPNPAKGTVTVEGAADGERVEIVDMEGRVVIGERPLAGSPSTVDISHLAPGVYLVRLSGPTGSATRKLVVE
jgi:hypothetical protein